jgi:nicotinamide-nucleotide amidase
VLANISKTKLVFNFPANQKMYQHYKKLGRDFATIPSSNFIQCMLPENSHFIPNVDGTACGIVSKVNNAQIIALPGVPHEMKSMMETLTNSFSQYLPRIGSPYISKVMTLFGLSESRLGEMIKDFMVGSEPIVGITAKTGYLQISVMGFSEIIVEKTFMQIANIAHEFVLSLENKTPPEILIDICRNNNWSIGAIESCTGGLISDAFVSIPGASDVFQAGAVSYSNEAKTRLANVSPQMIAKFGAVSEEVVGEMAIGFAVKNNLSICLSSSGVAGPDGGTVEKPVGFVCLGLYFLGDFHAFTSKFGGNRQNIRARSVIQIIGLTIQTIRKKTHH